MDSFENPMKAVICSLPPYTPQVFFWTYTPKLTFSSGNTQTAMPGNPSKTHLQELICNMRMLLKHTISMSYRVWLLWSHAKLRISLPSILSFWVRSGGKARTCLPGLHLQIPQQNSSAWEWRGRQTCGCWLWCPSYRAARARRGSGPAAAGLPASSYCCEAQSTWYVLSPHECPLSLPTKIQIYPSGAIYRLSSSDMFLGSP